MAKQEELQEQVRWFREHYTVAEPELPLTLDAQVLKQRALTAAKPRVTASWKKLMPMACALVLVAAVGLYSERSATKAVDTAEPQIASYSLAEASYPQTAAYDERASSLLRVVEYSVEIKTHTVGADSKSILRELYPGIKFYTLTWVGDFWTVIHVRGIEGDVAVAVRADETEVLEEENCYVVRELESGKELRFDMTTLKKIK